MPQGQFTWPEAVKSKGSPGDAQHRLGDDALATVDDFVSGKLGV